MNPARSPLVEKILQATPNAYASLVVSSGTPEKAITLLKGVTPAALLERSIVSPDDASAMLAGLWLWHDALEESHHISQSLETPSGSFWHAILHRREGDFSNAKYWYARCRHHPAIDAITTTLGEVWEPGEFVSRVSRAHDRPDHPDYAELVRVQRVEWDVLFDHCVGAATGRANQSQSR